MNKKQIELLKAQLTELLSKQGISKFEIIFDFDDTAFGIRSNYTNEESIYNFEARKHYLLNNALSTNET